MIPWDWCTIEFRLTRPVDMHQLGLCEELPLGWVVGHMEQDPSRRCWMLSFDVQGEARASDGQTVYRILARMGAVSYQTTDGFDLLRGS